MIKQLDLDAMVEPKEVTKYCVYCKHNRTPAVCLKCLEDGREPRARIRSETKICFTLRIRERKSETPYPVGPRVLEPLAITAAMRCVLMVKK